MSSLAVGVAIGGALTAFAGWVFLARAQTEMWYGAMLAEEAELGARVTSESLRLNLMRAPTPARNADGRLKLQRPDAMQVRVQESLVRELAREQERIAAKVPRWRKELHNSPERGSLIGGTFAAVGGGILLRCWLAWRRRFRNA